MGDVAVRSHDDLATALSPDGHLLEAAILRVMANGRDNDLLLSLAKADGAVRSARVALRAVTDESRVTGVLGCVVDVTELRCLANTDVLTGLHNRRAILETLEADLVGNAGKVSVIFCDLDGFKGVNDRYGHHAGDELLAAVADKLRSALRPGARIGRLGGDEFLVVCPGLAEPKTALALAARLQEALDAEFHLAQVTLRARASLGVACGRRGVTADELISCSDSAMYKAKRAPTRPPVQLECRTIR
jgi:diguanylate cyclase (GGDEF)-like protein